MLSERNPNQEDIQQNSQFEQESIRHTRPLQIELKTLNVNDSFEMQYVFLSPVHDEINDAILCLPFGSQSQDNAVAMLTLWQSEALNEKVMIIAPVAKDQKLYHDLPQKLLKKIVDRLREEHNLKDSLHIAGSSNGGLSAFSFALAAPEHVASLTVMPGFPPPQNKGELKKLKDIKVKFITGEYDKGFLKKARKALAKLESYGASCEFTVMQKNGHNIAHMVPLHDLIK